MTSTIISMGLFLCILSALFSYLFQELIPAGTVILAVLFLVIFILLFVLFNLKCFIYEFSGEVITIKIFHPFKKTHIHPCMEFPKDSLKDYSITKSIYGHQLKLYLKSERRKEIRVKCKFSIDREQLINLSNSLCGIKKSIYK